MRHLLPTLHLLEMLWSSNVELLMMMVIQYLVKVGNFMHVKIPASIIFALVIFLKMILLGKQRVSKCACKLLCLVNYFRQYNYSIVPRNNGGYLAINTVSIFHHGYYRCLSACIVGEFVALTVIGKCY